MFVSMNKTEHNNIQAHQIPSMMMYNMAKLMIMLELRYANKKVTAKRNIYQVHDIAPLCTTSIKLKIDERVGASLLELEFD